MFPDRSPAAEHHYLVITKVSRRKYFARPPFAKSILTVLGDVISRYQACIKDVQCLGKDDIPMVQEMEAAGLRVLGEQGGDTGKVMTGFHWPLHTVSHLHMHVIAPADNLRLGEPDY